ncbi:MAG: hypothetical protein B0D86_06630 [Candidatus Sedimenticola endophacoides]|uniref:Uncharacterized protein n=1 Tax=Candidatus Sedimenticola endophacoides TaxID=2548426 RepID=A0A6N4E596_9GAMM|nr:MAG: hypothetical protein B0D86_06630 [Candidatus Sedimenticola endophacoides]PUE05753.1 MAG: hypothetical protein C3L24_00305 [Candidatus Sedimenticola endophacoides]
MTETAVIEPGHARAFLQFGRWVPHGALNRFEPSCNLEVRDLSEFIQRVETDRFRVLEITQGWDMVVQGAGSHARAGWWGRRETDREINRYRRFRLHSPRQSAVMRLTCHAGDRDWREARPPAWREVLECVGDKIRFTVSAGERPA